MDGTLELEIDRAERPPVLRIKGDIDFENADAFRRFALDLAAETEGPVVFDVAGVTFVDSSGIAVLTHFISAGRPVVLRHPPRIVRTVLAATGLERFVETEP